MITFPGTLIFSCANDPHVHSVLSAMHVRAKPLLIDFSKYGNEFVGTWECNGDNCKLFITDTRGDRHYFSHVDRVWWRRPQPFSPNQKLKKQIIGYTIEEFRGFWGGMLSEISRAKWYNNIDVQRALDRKIHQLSIARNVGLRIPDTCITSEPCVAEEFIDRHNGDIVFKSFSGSDEFWQPTRRYDGAYKQLLKSLPYCPVIFQEFINPKSVYRTTVIDDRIFSAKKDMGNSPYIYDTRVDRSARHEIGNLPHDVQRRVLDYMVTSRLLYGAFDFVEGIDGFYFLEVNPAGQFLYIEIETGLGISMALADSLFSGTTSNQDIARSSYKLDSAKENGIFAEIVPDTVKYT